MSLILKPIVIIGCNRSGTTLLFRNLSSHPETWSLYDESQQIYYRYYPIHPTLGDLIDKRPSDQVRRSIHAEFFRRVTNKEVLKGHPILRLLPTKIIQRPVSNTFKTPPIRLVEKTPSNCFRIPFIKGLFPDAKFIFIVRRAEDVISSLMEGWKFWSGVGKGERWEFTKWHYLVPPGWQKWKDKRLEEICAYQNG